MTQAQLAQVITEKEQVLRVLQAKWERDNEALFLLNKRINELSVALDEFREAFDKEAA